MYAQVYYLVRSRADGAYLAAHLNADRPTEPGKTDPGYLLIFKEHFEALSYLNTHGAAVRDRFSVESVPGGQLEAVLTRWNFNGVGIVQDPLLPKVEFLARR